MKYRLNFDDAELGCAIGMSKHHRDPITKIRMQQIHRAISNYKWLHWYFYYTQSDGGHKVSDWTEMVDNSKRVWRRK